MKTETSTLAIQYRLFEFDEQQAAPGGSAGKTPARPAPTLTVVQPPAPLAAAVPQDFSLAGGRALAPTWLARARDNLDAIKVLRTLEAEGRAATAAEQARLAKFVGFGATELACNIFAHPRHGFRPGWEGLGQELVDLTSPVELQGLMRATQFAHYTPETIVRAMWAAVGQMGFAGGQILEPGCGSGLFMALRPAALDDASIFMGVENDPITAGVAKALFPNQVIRSEDFTKVALPDDFDLAIGNPPFSSLSVRNKTALGRLRLSLHDFFIARSIEALRPGGLGIFVTSRYTMDKSDARAREHISSMADFLGAVRLPRKAMLDEAGTEVVVDILLFRRRGDWDPDQSPAWLEVNDVPNSDAGEGPLRVNRYFLDHPTAVLGQHSWTSGQFGPEYTCNAPANFDLATDLAAAIATVVAPHAGRYVSRPAGQTPSLADKDSLAISAMQAGDHAALRESSYVIENDVLFQIVGGMPTRVSVKSGRGGLGLYPKHAAIIRRLIPIRDGARAVLRAQQFDEPYQDLQSELAKHYRAFTKAFGPINKTITTHRVDPETGTSTEVQRRPNLQPFMEDPDVWLVSSIEEYDEERDAGAPGPIFYDRVIHAPSVADVQSAGDALAVSLHETGRVDLSLISSLLGISETDALAELGDAVFLDPGQTTPDRDVWITADEALSGPVRTNLAITKQIAALDRRFERNVEALEAVQPVDLKPSDITARLGAPWIPTSDIETFIAEVMDVRTQVYHTVEIASWTVNKNPFLGQASAMSTWGTGRRGADDLLEDALNSCIPKIWDVWRDSEGEHRELNVKETEAAKEKLAAIRSAFEKWVWQDSDRADRLVRTYNDLYNNLVIRQFDGRHLTLPGASNTIQLRDHQKRAIWRVIAAGSTYIAHSVGSGKTFSLAAIVMEQKRLGLVSKPMVAVPNHCLAQMAREWLMLYPTARILVADETNFARPKRQRFLARAATGNWDAIIITHDAFKFIPTPTAFEENLIDDQIESFTSLIQDLDSNDRVSRKRLERMKQGMRAKLELLKARKDDLVHIGEIGIDQILVDEAHLFRKLSFATNQSDLKGIDPDGSQRAWDLYVKSLYLDTINDGRALVLASGTPITNTLGEMFTIQRYLQPVALAQRGIHEFDAWAANFGETRTELELQPSGSYKPVTRFSEFVNVADLMAMYRSVADVVLKDDLRQHVKLPVIKGGKREIVVAPSGEPFKDYQKFLAARIKAIENRTGAVQKGDDIILSVIGDGRHSAIDLRFVIPGAANDPDNKLNTLVANVFEIYQRTSDQRYQDPETGKPYPLAGAVQMIFSDLGTENALNTRGFSAYTWIRDELIRLGVPADEIAFMQNYKKTAAKQRLFNDLNNGRKRIILGSTATMGTGVNAQQRLKALHHLDVPWLPADIEQREGRIERQGNQHDEIEIYAYALRGSIDATSWQMLERKARFIALAMSGDRSIRRLEDVGSDANQFALAKALASGDERLMKKAGLEAEIARLQRLRDAHIDDQFNVRRTIDSSRRAIVAWTRDIANLEHDIARRVSTKADSFRFRMDEVVHTERKAAGDIIISRARLMQKNGTVGAFPTGSIGGFDLELVGEQARYGYGDKPSAKRDVDVELRVLTTGSPARINITSKSNPLGTIAQIENVIRELDGDLSRAHLALQREERRLPAFEARVDQPFTEAAELTDKLAELAELEADLARSVEEPANDDEAPADDMDQAALAA
ncbi:helicase-related protein [Sphingosinicella sp. BN140058]|uniref:helicase-related protein n=1 Tax=Sphingosinicella sp. BN140058 TaxID=1892855 RepID=UPI0010120CA5|nr:helicase-related protein [Sphingosinicella sp. BN140058]QAY80482.1 lactate dehydrogenase [Sphingosinicella sp. BN140058]